jgi:hypothetical protein
MMVTGRQTSLKSVNKQPRKLRQRFSTTKEKTTGAKVSASLDVASWWTENETRLVPSVMICD